MPAQLLNPPIFPSFVAQHTVGFDSDDATNWGVQFPGIVVPESLGKAVLFSR